MARLLTALVLLIAVTVTLASLASTAAARSARLLSDGMTTDGASGAVDTAGGAITAESAPSFPQPSAGDEQGRRRELVSKSSCDKTRNRDCSISVVTVRTRFGNATLGATDPAAARCNSKQHAGPAEAGACSGGGGGASACCNSLVIMWVSTV
ncbi:unnamed protein product [Closterium sp. NIES-53]